MIKCSVIMDLLPLYVDHICSQDTTALVEEHLKHCDACRQALCAMEPPDYPQAIQNQDEIMNAKKPFQAIRKKYHTKILIAVLLSVLLTIVAYQVIQNVEVLHRTVLPLLCTTINASNDAVEWQQLYFEGVEYLVFDSVFYHKALTNSTNSTGALTLQIKDTDGQVLITDKELLPGETLQLDFLKLNTPYIVNVKHGMGQFFVNVS